ncbi:hypothetical protein HBI05_138590 [Parastagonospora nodorum]|nr:hypothetical protein HBI05_138590 [Parastagonospora nodorum]
MAPTQTQTLTSHHEQFSKPITLTGRISKPATRTTTRTPTNPNKSLLSYTPQIPPPHPDIPISLLRNKLLLQCRPYIPSRLLHEALADGLYARATHWITPASLTASRHGKHKRYFVLHTSDFSLQQVGSAWEARVCANSRGIDAGNGVTLFVRERSEWHGSGSGSGNMRRFLEEDQRSITATSFSQALSRRIAIPATNPRTTEIA